MDYLKRQMEEAIIKASKIFPVGKGAWYCPIGLI